MIKVRLNSDKSLVESIENALVDNYGYCPCSILRNDDTHCMCKEFRDFIHDGGVGLCHCGLYESYEAGETI